MKALGFEQYERLSERGALVPVFREVPADLWTPVSAFLTLAETADRAFLFESVVGGERLARYSFLGFDPIRRVSLEGQTLVEEDDEGRRELTGDLLTALRERLGHQAVEVEGLPRFTGGAVGYLTYDAVRLFERVPDRHPPGELPVASFSFYRTLVAFDHARQRMLLITHAEAGRRAAFTAAQETLENLERRLREPRSRPSSPPRRAVLPEVAFEDAAAFRESVQRAKEYIAAGDIFQVVLSRQQTLGVAIDPFEAYRALRMVNPSPYMYFIKDGAATIAGASPERLVRVEGGWVEARPIAGTRPRGADDAEDDRLGRELLADEKERAEHIMLVDLGRNDLGRVCRFETITVPEFMKLERYSHVTHIVSSVRGRLRDDKDALDALVAAFPAGTLSGAPKIRAMEIIDELEPTRRALYGGALGYIDLRGNLDFCIAIRTLVFSDGRATIQAGAGIVADSDPVSEQRETEAKAGAMLEALCVAQGLG